MKKLLGILGTITISGSGVAGLVGNAPASSKTERNSLQTNNLEILNRSKRNLKNKVNTNISFLKEIEVSDNNEFLKKPIIYNKNIIYFITSQKVIEYNLEYMTSNVVLTADTNLKFGAILNDRLYVFSYGGVIYEYNIQNKISNLVYDINDNNGINPRITYGTILNDSICFITDFGGNIRDKIYRYNPGNNHLEVIFEDFNIEDLHFSNSDGLSKIIFVHNNEYYKYFGGGNVVRTNIVDTRNNNQKILEIKNRNNRTNLYDSEYSFSDEGFKIYERNRINLTKIYDYNYNYDYGNNWIFKLNGKIYFGSKNAKKFNEYYSFESILRNEEIFSSWIKDFDKWINDLNNININLLTKNEANDKIQIFLSYLREFNQNLEILKNKEDIKKLNSRVSVIENNISNLRTEIISLINKMNNPSSNNKLTNCSNYSSLISSTTGLIPVVGTLFSAVSGTFSAICTIANS